MEEAEGATTSSSQPTEASASCRSKPASPLRAAQAMASSLCKSCRDIRCYRVDMTTSRNRCERIRSPSDCLLVVTTQDKQGMVGVFTVLLSGQFFCLGLFVVWAFRVFLVLFGRWLFFCCLGATAAPAQTAKRKHIPSQKNMAGRKGCVFFAVWAGRGVCFCAVGRAGRGRCFFLLNGRGVDFV